MLYADHPWTSGLTKYSLKYKQTYNDPNGGRYNVTRVVIKITMSSGVTGFNASIFSTKQPEEIYSEDADITCETNIDGSSGKRVFTFTPKSGKNWDIISRDYTFKIKGDVNFILETGVKKGYDFSILNVKYQKMNQSSVQQLTPIAGG